jgi:hypothetical protein
MEGDVNEDNEFGGFAIDLGVIDLDSRDGRAAILNEDSASVGTTNPPTSPGFQGDYADEDMEDDDSMPPLDSNLADTVPQPRQDQSSPVTDSDLVQRFLNNPNLLRQLQLAQMNPSTPEEPLDPEGAQELE